MSDVVRNIFLLTCSLTLIGCPPPTASVSEPYRLAGVECQTADVSSWTGKTMPTLCRDKDGRWWLVATPGTSAREAMIELEKAGALVGLGYFAGKGLEGAGSNIHIPAPQIPK